MLRRRSGPDERRLGLGDSDSGRSAAAAVTANDAGVRGAAAAATTSDGEETRTDAAVEGDVGSVSERADDVGGAVPCGDCRDGEGEGDGEG